MKEDFRELVQLALHEHGHGHGGYTGSITEKSSFITFPPQGQDLSALDVRDVILALRAHPDLLQAYQARQEPGTRRMEEAVERFSRAFPQHLGALRWAQEAYSDRWGEAVAFRHGGEWHFCGTASC